MDTFSVIWAYLHHPLNGEVDFHAVLDSTIIYNDPANGSKRYYISMYPSLTFIYYLSIDVSF
jgi:hypothetical protein